MNHGTYHETINAGFTTEQAAFFARAYCETKNEAERFIRSYQQAHWLEVSHCTNTQRRGSQRNL